LQTITEPTFGTKITRITGDVGVAIPNVSPAENWLNTARHGYSTRQPFNSDESIIWIEKHKTNGGSSGSDLFLDGETYAVLKSAENVPSTWNEIRWSETDPKLMILLKDTEITSWHYDTEVETTLISFAGYTGTELGGTGNFSRDGNILAIQATRTSDSKVVLFGVNIDTQTKHPDIDMTGFTISRPMTSALGTYIMAKGNFGGGDDRARIYNTVTGAQVGDWTENGRPSHDDMIIDENGDECSVGVDKSGIGDNGLVIKRRLSDGTVTILNTGGYASHTSARGSLGRAYSIYSSTDVSTSYPPYRDEIIITKSDGSKVERIGHIRHSFDTYDNEAQPVASPSGTRVIFASDWNSGTYPIQGYIIDFRNN
jgi:hypothetical protein